ncbi:MAG TPA: flippase [Chloroflexaceae bacterium]|nr:flippase [Chloroflexaceae bacterium]
MKNAGAMLVSQVVTWTLTLVFSIVMRRVLGPEGSGHIVIAQSIWLIAGVFIGFGMDLLLTKEIARNHERAAELLGTSYLLRIGFYMLGGILVLGYSLLMGYDPQTTLLIQVVGLSTLFMQLAKASQATHQGLETMEYISISDIASKLANTLLGVLVLFLGFRELAVAWVLVVATLVLFLTQVYFLRRRHGLRPVFRRDLTVWMLRSSLPYMASVFGMVAYGELSVITISMQVGVGEVGWYGAASQIFGTLLFGAVVYNTVTFPSMARAHTTSPERMPELLRRNLELILLISVPIGLGVVAVGDKLMLLLFGPPFAPSGQILQVMGFILIFMYLNVLFGQYFNSIDRQHIWTTVVIISALSIVPLNFVTVPWAERAFGVGALGGAFSFLITEVGQFVAGWLLVPKGTLNWRSVRYILQVSLAGALMVACVWMVREMFIVIPIVVGALAYPALALMLRVVSHDDIELIRQTGRGLFARIRSARTKPA